jgi:hypothetical protein
MTKRITIVLVTPDESFEIQGNIIKDLIQRNLIREREVVDTDECSITIDLEESMTSPKVKSQVMNKFRPYIDIRQSKFDDGGGVDANTSPTVTSGSAENKSTSDQNGEGAGSGIVVGVGEGMGNANLKGTTFIAGNDKRRSKIKLDEIIHDQSQYTATEYPRITYGPKDSTIYLPTKQESYSVGLMTKSDVNFLNKKIEEQFEIFSSDLPENKGNIVPPVASPDDVLVVHNEETPPRPDEKHVIPDDQLRGLNEDRSKDARDPNNNQAHVITKKDLIDIIRQGQEANTDTTNCAVLPVLKRIEEKLSPKEELVQRMLAFNEQFGIDQMVYSLQTAVGGYMAKKATTNLVRKTAENAAEKNLGPGTGQYASKAVKPVAQVAGKQAGNLAKNILK